MFAKAPGGLAMLQGMLLNVKAALLHGLQQVFFFGAVMMVAAVVPHLFLKRVPSRPAPQRRTHQRRRVSIRMERRIVSLTMEEPKFIGVIIQAPTGVVYEQQCGGTHCDHQSLEGYFVPLSRRELDDRDRMSENRFALDTDLLKAVFHDAYPNDDDACVWGSSTESLPSDRLERLAGLVALLCYRGADYEARMMELDGGRLAEGCEAWVPVLTPDGRGMLVWNNCD